jgi:putative flippase GtrA
MEKLDSAWPYYPMDDLRLVVKYRRTFSQLYRYGLVGIASNLAGFMVYLLITQLGGTPKITMTILYGVGAVVGFWGNREMTFSHKGSLLGTGVRYIVAHCFGYFINLAILVVMVDKLGFVHQWVQAFAIFIVAAFLFLAFKFFVFRESQISNKKSQ